MVHGNIKKDNEASHTVSNAKNRSLKISHCFSKNKWKTFFIW